MDQRPGVVFQHSQEGVKQEGDDRRGKKTACVDDNFLFLFIRASLRLQSGLKTPYQGYTGKRAAQNCQIGMIEKHVLDQCC